MRRDQFIKWIKDLGFSKTWNNSEGREYSILIGNENNNITGIFHEKIYFIVEDFDIRLYYSNFKSLHLSASVSYVSNLGHFGLKDIGNFEKSILLSVIIKHFKEDIPPEIRSYLRDSKIKNILED
jgi:hypothetical protein